MTKQEREQVRRLRAEGMSYAQIAGLLEVSQDTVKSFCQRNGMGREGIEAKKEITDPTKCAQCGVPLIRIPRRKPRRFCSDDCRKAWWHTHRGAVSTAKVIVCAECKQVFRSAESRKFCSVACNANHRFGRKDRVEGNVGS